MPVKTSYYAIINEFSSRERPGGVMRRVEDSDGEHDEAFTRDLVWKRTDILYAAERGNMDNQFMPISEDEAMRIVERIRREATQS
jgi:hypothetical protein